MLQKTRKCGDVSFTLPFLTSLQPDAVCCSGDDASVSALKLHTSSVQRGDTAPGPGEVRGAGGAMAETLLEQGALLVGME